MRNNIITIVLVIVVGMVAVWYLTKTDNTENYLTADVQTTDSTDAKYIYNILQQMAQVTLDDSIFSNTTFQSLKDNTVSFTPQLSGRNNPFAPIGTDSNISGQTSQPSTTP
jgi:hypothetical protein